MPRPRKWRRVCCMPGSRSFGPLDGQGEDRRVIVMTVDEFEAIRLIDLEGLSQEECAQRMNVARTTAQAIYGSARAKLAECLVQGIALSISGGDYILCGDGSFDCGCSHCHRRRGHHDETYGRTGYAQTDAQEEAENQEGSPCSADSRSEEGKE